MRTLLTITMVLALSAAVCGIAYAADAPAAAAPAKPAAAPAVAAPAPPAAAPAAPVAPAHKAEAQGIKAVVKGKVSSKMVNMRGQEREMFELAVSEAKGADGKAMDDLKGKPLHIGSRDKAEEIKKFVGKDAEVTGMLMEGRRGKMLRVESIK